MFGTIVFGIVPFATTAGGVDTEQSWVDICKSTPNWTPVIVEPIENLRCKNAT